VAYVETAELANIEGFDEDLAAELQNRATEALERRETAARDARRALGVEDALAELEGLTEAMLVVLGGKGIKTLDDLGDLATDELVSKRDGLLKDFGLSDEDGNNIIMAARKHWFEDEDAATGEDANADAPQ
jgi:N utilization substance protein A